MEKDGRHSKPGGSNRNRPGWALVRIMVIAGVLATLAAGVAPNLYLWALAGMAGAVAAICVMENAGNARPVGISLVSGATAGFAAGSAAALVALSQCDTLLNIRLGIFVAALGALGISGCLFGSLGGLIVGLAYKVLRQCARGPGTSPRRAASSTSPPSQEPP